MGSSADLALLEQNTGDDLVEEADQAEHGVVRQVLLRKLPLHSTPCRPFQLMVAGSEHSPRSVWRLIPFLHSQATF